MKRQKGFTLAEVLITLTIIGVISILAIQTVRSQRDNFAFSCYHFFRDLKLTVGHMGASTVNGGLNSYTCERAEDVSAEAYEACMASQNSSASSEPEEGEEGEEGETPEESGSTPASNQYLLDYRTGTGFCEGLAKYMGTASAVKCSAGDLNNATLSDVYGKIGNNQDENFRLMNGYLIYVSDRVQPASGVPYRIVTADVNGNGSPNKTGNDIISFAVFDNGEVLPLGDPASSTKHFIAVIKMRNIMEMPASDSAKKAVVNSMQHPAVINKTAQGKSLSFKDAYCKVLGVSTVAPNYCDGQSITGEVFKFSQTAGESGTNVTVPVSYCYDTKYKADGTPEKTVNGESFIAECEFNVIKPQVSQLIPISQDTYSSENTYEEGSSEEYAEAPYQIFQY